jgi:drug/metabolite transporter (DMT)-like permease
MNFNIIAVSIAFLSFSLFSIMNASNKYVLTNSLVNPYIYFVGIGVFQLMWVIIIGYSFFRASFFKVHNKKVVMLRALILVINVASTTFAVSYLPLDIFYSIVFIMPLLATIMARIFLKESITKISLMAIGIGFLGTMIVIKPVFSNKLEVIGVVLCLITAITGVLSGIIGRKYLKAENPFSVSLYTAMFVGLAGFIVNSATMIDNFSVVELVNNIKATQSSGFWLLLVSSFCSIVASSLYLKAYQKGEVKFVAPMQYIQIIWGTAFGYFLFADVPQITTIIGVIVIIFANIINNKTNSFKKVTK